MTTWVETPILGEPIPAEWRFWGQKAASFSIDQAMETMSEAASSSGH